MTESVNAVAGSLVDAPEYSVPANQDPVPSGELGKDAFLKLLVAQLKYQDPLEPSSSEEFIATTAQFTVVEKLDELTKQGENTQLVNSLTTASTLIGREVTATQGENTITAVVERSKIVSGEVVLQTRLGPIGLNEVVSVGQSATSPTPPVLPAEPTEQTTPVAATVDEATAVDQAAALDEASAVEPAQAAPNAGESTTDESLLAEPVTTEIEAIAPPVEPVRPTEATMTPAVEAQTIPVPVVPAPPSLPVAPQPVSPAEQPIDLTADEAVNEVAIEPVAIEPVAIEPVVEPIGQAVDETVVEPVGQTVDETLDEAVVETVDETVVDTVDGAVDEVAVEATDEATEAFDPFDTL